MAKEFIFQMQGVDKILTTGRTILQPTYLSFFPDAKIGVIGHNGAGKSTVMRIMAGLEEGTNGTTWLRPNATVGYLPQEPVLDENMTVRENIEQGVAATRDLLRQFEEVSEAFCDPDADFDKLLLLLCIRLRKQNR